jgi:trehalose 6-phosphate phosphatase
MKHVLAREQSALLADFARSRTLIGLDFDGTLAPIMISPDRVEVSARTRKPLDALARVYPTAVISGRARADVAKRLVGLPLFAVIGNHGLEGESGGSKNWRNFVARWLDRLHRDLDGLRGIEIEDKGLSVAIHYRRSRAKKKARTAIDAAVAGLGQLRVVGGKQVVNLLPEGAPHKGLALLALMKRARCDRAIYVGDDDTDEDVFALPAANLLPRNQLLAVRVGQSSTHAPFYLRNQGEVHTLLSRLCDARNGLRNGYIDGKKRGAPGTARWHNVS